MAEHAAAASRVRGVLCFFILLSSHSLVGRSLVGLADHALLWLEHFGRWARVSTVRYNAEVANPVGAVGVLLQRLCQTRENWVRGFPLCGGRAVVTTV